MTPKLYHVLIQTTEAAATHLCGLTGSPRCAARSAASCSASLAPCHEKPRSPVSVNAAVMAPAQHTHNTHHTTTGLKSVVSYGLNRREPGEVCNKLMMAGKPAFVLWILPVAVVPNLPADQVYGANKWCCRTALSRT
jgi:hypothetical protein